MIKINILNVKLLCLMSGALKSHIIELVVIFQICTSNCWGLRQIAEISLNFTPICAKSRKRLEGETGRESGNLNNRTADFKYA